MDAKESERKRQAATILANILESFAKGSSEEQAMVTRLLKAYPEPISETDGVADEFAGAHDFISSVLDELDEIEMVVISDGGDGEKAARDAPIEDWGMDLFEICDDLTGQGHPFLPDWDMPPCGDRD